MNRKNYVAIAASFSALRATLTTPEQHEAFAEVLVTFCYEAQKDNSAFNRSIFIDAATKSGGAA